MGNCNTCFVIFSMCSSVATNIGFFFPYWIKGSIRLQQLPPPTTPLEATYFGTYRRCAFPKLSDDLTELSIEKGCGRYSGFTDIPSVWWQLATLVMGFGTGLTIFSAVLALLSCWIDDMWTRVFIRGLGVLHLAAGLLITLALLLHPMGWDAREVKDVCQTSDKYILGSCRLYWSYFVLIAAATTELLLFVSALKMAPVDDPLTTVKDRYAGYEYAQDV